MKNFIVVLSLTSTACVTYRPSQDCKMQMYAMPIGIPEEDAWTIESCQEKVKEKKERIARASVVQWHTVSTNNVQDQEKPLGKEGKIENWSYGESKDKFDDSTIYHVSTLSKNTNPSGRHSFMWISCNKNKTHMSIDLHLIVDFSAQKTNVKTRAGSKAPELRKWNIGSDKTSVYPSNSVAELQKILGEHTYVVSVERLTTDLFAEFDTSFLEKAIGNVRTNCNW